MPLAGLRSCFRCQFLLLLPVVPALYKLSHQQHPGITRQTFLVGIGAVCFTVLFALLTFVNILADTLYMFPQGVVGLWLIVVCWRLQDTLSRALRWFGMIVGVGLILAGLFPIGYAIFVDRIILVIPAVDPATVPFHRTLANHIIHILLDIGSLLGVITLPFWTILVGSRLLRLNKLR